MHKDPESDPDTNHHLSNDNWVVLGTLLGQSLVRIDFGSHFVEVSHLVIRNFNDLESDRNFIEISILKFPEFHELAKC